MEAYGARKAILEGRLGANLTFHERKRAWEAVVEAVNAEGNEQRTAKQIKKRWENLVTAARKTIMEWEREKATKLYARFFNIAHIYVTLITFPLAREPLSRSRLSSSQFCE